MIGEKKSNSENLKSHLARWQVKERESYTFSLHAQRMYSHLRETTKNSSSSCRWCWHDVTVIQDQTGQESKCHTLTGQACPEFLKRSAEMFGRLNSKMLFAVAADQTEAGWGRSQRHHLTRIQDFFQNIWNSLLNVKNDG